MIALGLWFLAAFGFAFVVGHSKISLPVRKWFAGRFDEEALYDDAGQLRPNPKVTWIRRPAVPVLGPLLVALAECPGCLGWWLGAVVGAAFPMLVISAAPVLADSGDLRFSAGLVLSFSTSAVNLLLAKYVGMV